MLFVNGLEFEGWMARLIDASGFDGLRVVATEGIEPIAYEDEHDDHKDGHDKHDDHKDGHDKHDDHKDDHAKHDDHKEDDHHGHDHGAFDPHAWQSVRLAKIYADNITAALSKVAPEHAADFYANRAAFVAELDALDKEIRGLFANLTETKRTVVTA